MSTAHTSGNWSVLNHHGVFVVADESLTVCEVTYQFPDSAGETERLANARLLAAAPALLAAAERMEKRIAYYASCAEGDAPNIEQWAYTDGSGDVAILRTAIAKATGATP